MYLLSTEDHRRVMSSADKQDNGSHIFGALNSKFSMLA